MAGLLGNRGKGRMMAPAPSSETVSQSGLIVGGIHCIATLQLASKCGEKSKQAQQKSLRLRQFYQFLTGFPALSKR
jgi:hypothetical protein